MRFIRCGLLLVLVSAIGVFCAVASAAPRAVEPATAWSLQAVALPTNFSSSQNSICEAHPGAQEIELCDHYTIVPFNVGTRRSAGAITVVDTLPVGLTVIGSPKGENFPGSIVWTCTTSEVAGHTVVSCETNGEEGEGIKPLTPAASISIDVRIDPAAQGILTDRVEVYGGGAASPTVVETPTSIDAPIPSFAPREFHAATLDDAGATDTSAGSHPGTFTGSFTLPSALSSRSPGSVPEANPVEDPKQIVTELPPGLLGDALSAATCPLYDVTNLKESQRQCPAASRVGRLALIEPPAAQTELVIFNVVPEHGYAAEFAVYLPELARTAELYARLVGYGANARVRVISAPQSSIPRIDSIAFAFYGNPTLHAGPSILDENGGGSPFTATPFLTNPSDCEASDFTSTVYVDTWQNPGRVEPDGEPDLGDPNWKRASATMPRVQGCESLEFHPSITLAPEAGHRGADEPAAYETLLTVPQSNEISGSATPPLKRTVVTLPPGVAISPSAAVGLVGCELGASGIGLETEPESSQPGHCPGAAKIGEVEATTPLLAEPLKGGIYVAQPECGGSAQAACTEEAVETGGVFAIYVELGNENSGVHVKLKGTIEVGGDGHRNGLQPGQVRATFAQTPQDPVGELKLKFNGGPAAPLANPQTCGTFASTVEIEPWSHVPAPGESGTPNITLNPAYEISGCEQRFAPSFSAGTTNPQAGGFSPLTLTFSREDREQDLAGITVSMPGGLTGKIAGISECAEAEANSGSCPNSTRVGSATAAAGSGTSPLWQGGSVYFTGPYRGAPFGLSIVVPAKAGPYNLGDVVVRAALFIDPETAQVNVVSDPIPQSVDGVPLRLKTINTTIDREGFILNPTNCTERSLTASINSAQGTTANVASRFQAANCATLPFKPSFIASTLGKTSKASGASLFVRINSGGIGQAGFSKVDLTIPAVLPTRLTTIQKGCTEQQFDANPAGCPAASDIGTSVVHTPLLTNPLRGPVYFVSHGGAAFPDTEIVLQGEGVTLVLDGKTQITKGVTYSRFESIPDAPFTSFEFAAPEGPYSIFGANANLCQTEVRMPTTLVAQNGAVVDQNTLVEPTGCPNRLAILLHRVRRRTISLKVAVPSAGRLAAAGRGLTSAVKASKGRGVVTLVVKAKGRGKLKTTVRLSFVPSRGKTLSAVVAARLKA